MKKPVPQRSNTDLLRKEEINARQNFTLQWGCSTLLSQDPEHGSFLDAPSSERDLVFPGRYRILSPYEWSRNID